MRWLIPAALILLCACESQPDHRKAYIDMDSLVSAQVAMLTASRGSLQKEASVNHQRSSATSVPDSLGWADELAVFRQLDVINRPAYRNTYQVTDGGKDENSNLLVKAYTSAGNPPVAFLQLYYLKDLHHLKKITARYYETNQLFALERNLEMYFDDHSGAALLSGYRVQGQQKLILSDSVKYNIQSAIEF